MSKKITHIKAKENLKKISWSKGYFEKEEQELKDYITQQEKQEKLLELYKDLANVRNDIISLLISNEEYDEKEVTEMNLEKQIKELENE